MRQQTAAEEFAQNSTFNGAAKVPAYPTWGQPSKAALKAGRDRSAEVVFISRKLAQTQMGHFSPGPQYMLPSTIGYSDRESYQPVLRDKMHGGVVYRQGKTFDLDHLRTEQHQPISPTGVKAQRDFWMGSTTLNRNDSSASLDGTWRAEMHAQRHSPLANRIAQQHSDGATWPQGRVKRNSFEPLADPPFSSAFGRMQRGTEDFGHYAAGHIAGYGGRASSFGRGSSGVRQGHSTYTGVW
jgi:hypothetical protein